MGESTGEVIGELIQALIIAYVGGKWAAEKGYNGTLWFWACLLSNAIPLYGISLMEDQRLREATGGSRDEVRIAEGNNLGWIYLGIGMVGSVLLIAGAIWMRLSAYA